VRRVDALTRDGQPVTLVRDALAFGYRASAMMAQALVITGVEFALRRDDAAAIRARMDDYTARRRAKQPLTMKSAGSFFKRPAGQFAGKLIEDAGLKGFAVGAAQVSELHAGFIVNRGGASAGDILRLMEDVVARVEASSGVRLEPEVRIVGRD